MKTRQLSKAREIARGLPGVGGVSDKDGTLRISAAQPEGDAGIQEDPERWAASINSRLVRSGVEISDLRSVEQSLEEVFLELTGDSAEAEDTSEHSEEG